MGEEEATTAGAGPGQGTVSAGIISVILLLLVAGAMSVSWQLGVILERAGQPLVACETPSRSADSTRAGGSVDATGRKADSVLATPAATANGAAGAASSTSGLPGVGTGAPSKTDAQRRAVDDCTTPARRNLDLFFISLLAGALGGLLHSLRSFVWYVGNRDLRNSWLPRYLVLPVEGALLSAVVYLLIRAGFMGMNGITEVSPYGFAGAGALMGLFSQAAILKLKQVAETLFTSPPEGADARPQGETANNPADADENSENGDATQRANGAGLEDAPGTDAPVPVITAVSLSDEDGKTIAVVNGTGFRSATSVLVDGASVTSETISSREIKASSEIQLPISKVVKVEATTPSPGGGSATFFLEPSTAALGDGNV